VRKEELIAFEDSIAEEFSRGEIGFPVHLDHGNEDQLIRIFENFKPGDHVYTSWRSHYKALLAGVPEEELRAAIHRGESMMLNFPEYNVYGSAIVGGIVPIATGAAMSIQLKNEPNRVWVFMGDMTRLCGITEECIRYANNHRLPITFVTEDNGVSVLTDTRLTWGINGLIDMNIHPNELSFRYQSKWPHSGAKQRAEF
jgi:TPP-dependent pyruvate/acetoin dehydrogenase alpha subunit